MWALLLVLAITGASGDHRNFNVTYLRVPKTVPATQDEVELECRYDANFTILNWFKGPNEFFRYRPGAAPSTKSFPILGVGKIEMLACGPRECRLKLGSLTDDATGLYRCDIELDVPPYKFASKTAYMKVLGHEHRKPLVQGLVEEYGEGDDIKAYCRADAQAEIRWYINGREQKDMRGLTTLKKKCSKWFFEGVPPTMTVQCAEFQAGNLLGSKHWKARWRGSSYEYADEQPQEQRHSVTNTSNTNLCSVLMCILNLLLFNLCNIY